MPTKEKLINELVSIAFALDEKASKMNEKTKQLQRMAYLAKQGLKDTQEYKNLEIKFQHPTVTDFGNEINEIQKIVPKLKKFKWDNKEKK